MNYYQPREKTIEGKPAGFYHFTCRNDDQIWCVGACRDGGPEHEHKTPEEAVKCFHDWAVQQTTFDGRVPEPHADGAQRLCCLESCSEPATKTAVVNVDLYRERYRLCATHATLECVAELLPEIHNAMASW